MASLLTAIKKAKEAGDSVKANLLARSLKTEAEKWDSSDEKKREVNEKLAAEYERKKREERGKKKDKEGTSKVKKGGKDESLRSRSSEESLEDGNDGEVSDGSIEEHDSLDEEVSRKTPMKRVYSEDKGVQRQMEEYERFKRIKKSKIDEMDRLKEITVSLTDYMAREDARVSKQTAGQIMRRQRDSDSQLPVAESNQSGGSFLSSSSSYPDIPEIIVPKNPEAPDSVLEKPTIISLRNSISSIASNISEAGSEPKKRKVIENDHEMEIESNSAKSDSCLATRFDELQDETHAGLERIRVRHKFSSVLTDYVKQQFHIVKRIALELAFENTRLAAKNEYLSDLVDRRLLPSYSSVAAQGAVAQSSRPQQNLLAPKPKTQNKLKPLSPSPSAGRKKSKTKKSFVVVVSSSKDEPRVDSEVLMSVLKSTIDPVGDGIHVRSVNKSRSGRLFVETASKQDLEKLISNAGLKEKGVSVTLKERRLPRMIIYDVPVVQTDSELSQLLRKQNPILTPQQVLKPIFKVGKRDSEVIHWVMEVSPECRDTSLSKRAACTWGGAVAK
ncbi:unnamed protein product [Trichogramma brassicae]|uniref:Uncharacterized protein n=1 Tax=Trichogramma brassicae TaxID=86971 RepID=A0A6H5IBD8_9HYME|nr:unnamed protein product [Trichogramma brassicae]